MSDRVSEDFLPLEENDGRLRPEALLVRIRNLEEQVRKIEARLASVSEVARRAEADASMWRPIG